MVSSAKEGDMKRESLSGGEGLHRRSFLKAGAVAGLAGVALGSAESARSAPQPANQPNQPGAQRPLTQFQIACMTLPYSQHPFERALEGIRRAGYNYVALGTTHPVDGQNRPILASDATAQQARDVGQRCRDHGLTPVMMFSGIYPEANNAVQVLTNRIQQAAGAQIPQVLTFGHTAGGNRNLWVQR